MNQKLLLRVTATNIEMYLNIAFVHFMIRQVLPTLHQVDLELQFKPSVLNLGVVLSIICVVQIPNRNFLKRNLNKKRKRIGQNE